MIKLLDSTLRDGGYIVDFNFGEDKIRFVLDNLIKSNIDFIELGFLSEKPTNPSSTIFNSIEETKKYTKNYDSNKFCLMIKSGDFDINKLPSPTGEKLRYIFKKHQLNKALFECEEIIKKGYSLFINPVFIDEYNSDEFLELIKKLDSLNPYAISIVDSMGTMNDISEFFLELDKIIKKDTPLCFHAHNNTEYALINAKNLIKLNLNRDIIIDCTIAGIGRGAGNICTEILMQYLKDYNIEPLEEVIDSCLNKIYEKTPWGNSYSYYLSGLYKCHSDYSSYLEKHNLDIAQIEDILSKIPQEEKTTFNKTLIKNLLKNINSNKSCNN